MNSRSIPNSRPAGHRLGATVCWLTVPEIAAKKPATLIHLLWLVPPGSLGGFFND